ncbi:MAG: cytochrome c oxidase subunit II [Alphaproteobacteria bacterium]|nr:cytochrome c oxidase subunit II [Alphaproteobacteria bacterium]
MHRIIGIVARWARHFGLTVMTLITTVTVTMAAEPQPWQLGFQPAVTPTMEKVNDLHNLLLVIITAITIFVLGLLVYVGIRYRASANPNPSRTTHNTVIEVLWTVIPVAILVLIAIPSFKLLYYGDRAVDPDMTVKVTANRWYWNYEYADENMAFDSSMIPEGDLQPGQKRLLDVDNRLVVPVGAKVQVLVTTNDVMHSFFMPSFGVQVYGTPGRINETWFQVTKAGVYYGQCNQICGLNHSKMPIVVEAMEQEDYETWLEVAQQNFALNDKTDPGTAPVKLATRIAE